jgi:formylglycine-generating enzyme required for sulfatase activity
MLALKSKLGMIAGVLAVSFGAAPASMLWASPARFVYFETVDVAPRVFYYRQAGDFSQAGRPVDAPLAAEARASVLHIMKQQVTVADYDRCVAETKCMASSPLENFDPNLPTVQVSWRDATAYAAWLSAKTGETWRLPTDEEWVFAAGSRFHDDALLVAASRDPSVRWLARYEKESDQDALDQRPRPPGAFGANEYGLLDLSGNVWEWTSTCFIRQPLDAKGNSAGASTANCGVRVVEGEHRTYVTDFVRDAKGGGCAVGKPPSNLGFRLVREDNGIAAIASVLRRLILKLLTRGAQLF